MSTRKVKTVDVGMVPFFVRFLEGQNAESEESSIY